jgi:hypothetical protein
MASPFRLPIRSGDRHVGQSRLTPMVQLRKASLFAKWKPLGHLRDEQWQYRRTLQGFRRLAAPSRHIQLVR